MNIPLSKRFAVKFYRCGGGWVMPIRLGFPVVILCWRYPESWIEGDAPATGIAIGWMGVDLEWGAVVPCKKWLYRHAAARKVKRAL